MWVKLAWPGPRIAALHMLEPAATRGFPSTSTSVSTLPIPFCRVIAKPSGASAAAAVSAARRVLFASVQIMARSASRPRGRSTVALAGIRSSPFTPSRRRPPALIAATCSAQVSTNVTSWPARASRPPKVEPIAPAPITHTLIVVASRRED